MTPDQTAEYSLYSAIAAVVAAVAAIFVAIYTAFKANRNSSVATMVTLNESAREAWHQFIFANSDRDRSYPLAELLNTLEIACSILNEGSCAGVSKELLGQYLKEAISALKEDSDSSRMIEELFSDEKTFEHIQKYYKERPPNPMSITTPRQWFQRRK
jgi:hypothetical protein